jgi:hypothetical protein
MAGWEGCRPLLLVFAAAHNCLMIALEFACVCNMHDKGFPGKREVPLLQVVAGNCLALRNVRPCCHCASPCICSSLWGKGIGLTLIALSC